MAFEPPFGLALEVAEIFLTGETSGQKDALQIAYHITCSRSSISLRPL
jgi:hypothetical protein